MSDLRARVRWISLVLAPVASGCPEPEVVPVRTAVHVAPDSGARRPPSGSAEAVRSAKDESARPTDRQARARLIDREGNTVGQAEFYEIPVGVALRLRAEGLPPGRRGVHIHEHGLCNPGDDFESAGEHWAPDGGEHGLENPEGPHAGDMPNLEVGDDGSVEFHYILPRATLRPEGEHSLLSGNATAIVIHARKDDQRTDPAGRAGARIVCGVIDRTPAIERAAG